MTDLNRTHPSPDQLAAFGSGQLDDPAAEEIDAHLADCETCRTVVEALPQDTLVALLRAVATPPPASAAEVTESLVPPVKKVSGPDFAAKSGPDTFFTPPPAPTCTHAPATPALLPELAGHPRYRVLELLGHGGMGAVYKAEHLRMERLVALKVLKRTLLDEPDAFERFRREVKAAARLAHPNIVAAHDADQAGDLHFLVMEYVEGTTLARLVQEHGPLPVPQACDYVRQAALGLQHAYERGMIHRDIKPQNLMLTPSPLSSASGERGGGEGVGRVKILDFGLARLATAGVAAEALTETNVVMGTPDYIAPEQARDAHSADIRADLYSLGCTLYFMLTGQPPFPGGTSMQKIMKHLDQTPKPLSHYRNDLPVELVRVVERMMAKDRDQRYQTPAEVAQELVLFISPRAAEPVVAVPPPPRPPAGDDGGGREGRGPGRRRWLQAALRSQRWSAARVVCLVLLVALGLGGAFLAPAIYRVATNQGTLVVETDDPNVEVIVKQGGEQVQIIDARTTHTVELKAGTYELKLADGKEALRLSTDKFSLKRGDKVVVRVWLEPQVAKKPAAPAAPQATKGPPGPAPGKASAQPDGLAGFAETSFRRLDVNGDGLLSVDEMPETLRAERDRWDTNRDGSLDLDEYKAYYVPRAQQIIARRAAVELLEVRTLVGHRQQVNSVAVSPDGRYVLSGGQDRTVRLWDVASGKEVRRFDGAGEPVLSVAFSPDGRRILTSGVGGPLRLWDVANGAMLRLLEGHKSAVPSVAFTPDGRHAVSGGEDTTVRLWDLESGRELRLFSGHSGAIASVAFSHDGRQVLSASKDRTLRLWNVDTGKDQRFTGHTGVVRGVAFAPDGRSIVSAGEDRSVRLWDVEKGELLRSFATRSGFTSSSRGGPAGNPSSSRSTTGGAASGFASARAAALPLGVTCVAFSPDGRRVLAGDGTPAAPTPGAGAAALPDYRVRLWDTAGTVLDEFKRHEKPVLSVAFSPDGRFAVSAGVDKTIRLLWLAEPDRSAQPAAPAAVPKDKGQLALEKESPDVPVIVKQAGRLVTVLHPKMKAPSELKPGAYELELATAADGLRLAVANVTLTAGEKKTVAIRRESPADKAPPAALTEAARYDGHTNSIYSLAISADGKSVLSGSPDRTARVWDLPTGKEIGRLDGHAEGIFAVAVSPDGSKAVTGGGDGQMKDGKLQGDFDIRLWDVGTVREIRRFTGHAARVWSLAFSADGRSILSGSQDQTLRLWEVESGQQRREFRGHEGAVMSVALSPDGRQALSGGWDATVRLWNVETGQEMRRFEGHTEVVWSVAFSPDARLALSGGLDKSMRLWDVASGQQLRRFAEHPTGLTGIAFSPDGRRAFSVSGCSPTSPGIATAAGHDYLVRLWDIASGQEIGRFNGHTHEPMLAAFAPDGRSAVSGACDRTLRLLKLPEPPNATIAETRTFAGHGGQIPHLVLSADGRRALSCGVDKTLRLWDVEAGKEIRRIERNFEVAWGVALSPDGKQALAGGGDYFKDGKWERGPDFSVVHLWDLDTGTEVRRFQGHTGCIRGVALSPDGRHALSGADDSTVRLWDLQTGKCLRVLQGHTDVVWHVLFSPDGRTALSSSLDKTLRLWDVATGRELRRFEGHREGIRGVAFSPDGTQLLSGGDDRTVRLWDVRTGQELRSFLGHTGPIYALAFSPDGQQVLSGSFDSTTRLWQASTGQELGRAAGSQVWSVAFLPGGLAALSCSSDGLIRQLQLPQPARDAKPVGSGDKGQLAVESGARAGWLLVKQGEQVVQVLDATSSQQVELKAGDYQLELAGLHDGLKLSVDRFTLGKAGKQIVKIGPEPVPAPVEISEVRRFPGHRSTVDWLGLSGDGRFAVTCGGDFSVRLWEVATGKEVRRFEGQTESVYAVAISPDGKYVLASGGGKWTRGEWSKSDYSLRLWEVATGKLVHRLEGHTDMVRSLAFSPDSRYALSGAWDNTVRLWDVQTGREVHTLRGHPSGPHAVAFSPDGRRALSGDWASALWLWDLTTGKALRRFEGHSAPVRSVAFSPDGRLALSASMDRTMRLWDVETGNQVRRFPDHPTGIMCVAWSADGRRILSSSGLRFHQNNQEGAGQDYLVRLWDVASGQEIGRFEGHTHVPTGLAFSPDGRFALATSWDRTVRLLGLSEPTNGTKSADARYTGQLTLESNGFPLPVLVKQGDKLVSVLHPKISRTTDLPIGKYELELAGQPEGFRLSADKVALTRDGKVSVAIQKQPVADRPAPAAISEIRRFQGHTGAVVQVALSPDGKQALSASWDKSLRLWDVETGQELHKFEGITEEVWTCAFSPDGQQALSAGGGAWQDGKFVVTDSTIRLWDVATRKEIRRFTGHKGRVWSATFSPDGKSILSGADDTTVRLWDVATGMEKRILQGHDTAVRRVLFSPDGRQALSGSFDATIRLWDLETGKEVRRFEGHTEMVSGVAFSPDGRQILSCSHMDGSMRLWDVETGRQLRTFAGLETGPYSVAFSADGKRALCGSGYRTVSGKGGYAGFDYRVHLWDLATGQEIGRSEDQNNAVGIAVFTPDGKRVLTGGEDSTLRLLKLPD